VFIHKSLKLTSVFCHKQITNDAQSAALVLLDSATRYIMDRRKHSEISGMLRNNTHSYSTVCCSSAAPLIAEAYNERPLVERDGVHRLSQNRSHVTASA
jgi:hypothetical protein